MGPPGQKRGKRHFSPAYDFLEGTQLELQQALAVRCLFAGDCSQRVGNHEQRDRGGRVHAQAWPRGRGRAGITADTNSRLLKKSNCCYCLLPRCCKIVKSNIPAAVQVVLFRRAKRREEGVSRSVYGNGVLMNSLKTKSEQQRPFFTRNGLNAQRDLSCPRLTFSSSRNLSMR